MTCLTDRGQCRNLPAANVSLRKDSEHGQRNREGQEGQQAEALDEGEAKEEEGEERGQVTRRGSTVPVHAALASPLVRLTVFPVFALAAIFALAVLDASRAHAAGALEAVTQGAASNLGPLASTLNTSVVVAAPLTVDDAAPRGDELALRVAALVAGRLGSGVRAHPQTAQLGTARAIAGRASALVYVQTAIAQGDLRTTIDVYPPMANAWDRIRNPLPSPTGHAF